MKAVQIINITSLVCYLLKPNYSNLAQTVHELEVWRVIQALHQIIAK